MRSISVILSVLLTGSLVIYAKSDKAPKLKIPKEVEKLENEERLKLMYDSFIFSKDLEHGYEVAKKAIKLYPNSLYWHKKLGEVCLWSGRSEEAMDHWVYLYNNSKDQIKADKLISNMLISYKYERVAPIIKKELSYNESEKNIKRFENINDKIGMPEESIETLEKLYKKNPSSKYLESMLKIHMHVGGIKEAEEVANKLQAYNDISVEGAKNLSSFYFVKRDLNKALSILKKVEKRVNKNDHEYFTQLSDLAWYQKDHNTAAFASLMLYRTHHARKVDYIRIQDVYEKKNLSLIKEVSIESFNKHKDTDFILNYAYKALENKKYHELYNVLTTKLKNNAAIKEIEKDYKYWLIKAQVSNNLKNKKEAKRLFEKALKLSPNSNEIKLSIMWYLIDNFYYDELEKMVDTIEGAQEIDRRYYFVLSSANLVLKRPDAAMQYMNELIEDNPYNIDYKFLRSEILLAQDQESAYKKELMSILDILDTQRSNNKALLKDRIFLRRYYQASIEFSNPDMFKSLLDSSKDTLSKRDYNELLALYYVHYSMFEKAALLISKMDKVYPSVKMDVALRLDDRDLIEKILKQGTHSLTPQQLVQAYEKLYQVPTAIDIATQSIEKNRNNLTLKKTLLDIYKDRANRVKLYSGYLQRGALKGSYLGIGSYYYVARGYSLVTEFSSYYYESRDKSKLTKLHITDNELRVGFKKDFYNTTIEGGITLRDAAESNVGGYLSADKQINSKLNIVAKIATNQRTNDQSIYYVVGGQKDYFSLGASYKYTLYQTLSMQSEYANFYSQDNVKLGSGVSGNIQYDYKFSRALNMGVRTYYNFGRYSVKDKKSVIDLLLPVSEKASRILQQDFNDIGVGVYYGNPDDRYGKSISPYVSLNMTYGSILKKFYADIEAGITGRLVKNDYYKLGVNYQNSVGSINEEQFIVNFDYNKLF